jgi:hypothetical protein
MWSSAYEALIFQRHVLLFYIGLIIPLSLLRHRRQIERDFEQKIARGKYEHWFAWPRPDMVIFLGVPLHLIECRAAWIVFICHSTL